MKKITVITVVVIALLMTTILIAGCANTNQAVSVPATKENLIEGRPTILDDGTCVIKTEGVVQPCTTRQNMDAYHYL